MRVTSPLPLPKLDSSIHGEARNTMIRVSTMAIQDLKAFNSAEAQLEFFTTLRDWANLNVANLEGLASGAAAGRVAS
jgi:hypothetical protein